MAKKRLNIRRIINQSNRLLLSYERKYSKQIASALREQLNHYAEAEEFVDTITPIIEDLYRSVTERYFIMQYTILEESLQKSIFMDTFRAWFEVYLKTQLAKKVTNINETTMTRLQQVLTPYIKGSFEWDEAVNALMKDFNFSAGRALMIARTEIGNANNVGKKQSSDEWAMQGSGAQYKIWIHRGAKNPRDWHMQLDNGKAIPKDMPFVVTDPNTGTIDAMDTPHDASASAGNVINCGCEVLYVSERYAVRNGMIDGTDYPIAQPTREIEAPQANETVTVGDLPPSTDKTISSDLADVFKELNINIDAKSVVYDNSLTLKDKNELKNKLNELVREYKMDIDVSKHQGVKLSFKSKGNTLGFVGNSKVHISEINFGHLTSKDSALKESVFRTTSEGKKVIRFTRSAIIDPENTRFSTLVHEFAHIITDEARTKGSMKSPANIKFWKDLKKIRKDYYTEMNSLIKIKDVESLNKIYISQYAQTNINEFMAESFMQYKLSSNPSPYAVRVGKLMDKNFKK